MAETNTKEALTAMRSMRANLTNIIERNDLLEISLERACRYLAEAQKYIGDGAYTYSSHHTSTAVKCRDAIAKNIADLRAVIDS